MPCPCRSTKGRGDLPAATAILDRFLHHAEPITITGKSYWMRNEALRKKNQTNETDGKNDRKGKPRPRTDLLPEAGEVEYKEINSSGWL